MPAIIKVVDGRTVIRVGENTAMAVAAASLAEQFANAAALAAAAVGVYGTTAEGIGATTNGQSFYVADGTDFALYENNAGVADLVTSLPTATDVNARVPYAELASTAAGEGAALVGTEGGGNVQTDAFDPLPTNGSGTAKSLLGAFHNVPATTPGGDDAPNVVLGSLGGTDLPASTYGNMIFTPRDNNVTGGTGYRNRIGTNTILGFVIGGNNDVNVLAPFIIGHHNRVDETIGLPNHAFILGTSNQVGGIYGIAIGTQQDNFANRGVIIGCVNARIGTVGVPTNAEFGTIIGGNANTMDGRYGVILGGYQNKANGAFSWAGGNSSVARGHGERTFSSGNFNFAGDQQKGDFHLFRELTGATLNQLWTDGISESLPSVSPNSLLNVEALVSAARTDGGGTETACYRLIGSLTNIGGTLVIKHQDLTVLHEDDATWRCDLQVSGSTWMVRVGLAAGQVGYASADVRYLLNRTGA